MTTLVELHTEMAKLRREIEKIKETLTRKQNRLTRCKKEAAHKPTINGDVDEIASSVLTIQGNIKSLAANYSDARTMVSDAIEQILQGGGTLKHEYQGCKSYDRWACQGCDCKYGYGPSHGSIIARIGLEEEARKRDLTAEEIAACIAYLNALL